MKCSAHAQRVRSPRHRPVVSHYHHLARAACVSMGSRGGSASKTAPMQNLESPVIRLRTFIFFNDIPELFRFKWVWCFHQVLRSILSKLLLLFWTSMNQFSLLSLARHNNHFLISTLLSRKGVWLTPSVSQKLQELIKGDIQSNTCFLFQ